MLLFEQVLKKFEYQMANEKLIDKYIKANNATDNCIKYYAAALEALPETFAREREMTATIKTFELAYETFWKYLKFYIEDQGILDVPGNPRGIFDLASKLNIITAEQAKELGKAGKDRNEAAHIYQQATADDIFHDIPEYNNLFTELLKKLNPNN